MKVLITNAYSARNKGDAGILAGMLSDLRGNSVFRSARITISSADFPNDSGHYDCTVGPSFHSLKRTISPNPHLQQLYFLLVLLPLSLFWALGYRYTKTELPVPHSLRDLLRMYTETDVVVAAGGGYLYTRSKMKGNVVLLSTLLSFFFGVLVRRPVYLYAQSVGPFAAPLQAAVARRALSKVRMIQLREEVSYRLLESWNLEVPLRLAADAAFLVPRSNSPPALHIGDEPGLRVGITVRNWFAEAGAQGCYEATMASFVDWLIGKGYVVYFVPQVTFAAAGDDDRVPALRIHAMLRDKARARVLEAELDAPQIKASCGRMDFFVGTRMHSNIFALSMGVPTLAVGYQPKTFGIMQQLGLSRFTLSIEELTTDELKEKFNSLVQRADSIRQSLQQSIPRMQEKAAANAGLIAQDYRTYRQRVNGDAEHRS